MNFFKSILSDDPDPEEPEKPQVSEPQSPVDPSGKKQVSGDIVEESDPSSEDDNPNSNPNRSDANPGGGWSFGGLIKTLSTRSESVLEVYTRDLREFGSGLKKETELFREVAGRAVKELPSSLEVGASVAHGSLETVGNALDGVFRSTSEIISQGKETLLSGSDGEPETPEIKKSLSSGGYSRFEAQLYAIQNDVNTFCEELDDSEEYKKWKSTCKLEEKSDEIEILIGDNGSMVNVYNKVVPNMVDQETFWFRYYYRIHKLKQQERLRANLVKRAISVDDEEELSWDLDDDENEDDVADKTEGKDSAKKEVTSGLANEDSGDRNSVSTEKKVNSTDDAGDTKRECESNAGNVVGPCEENASSDKNVKSEEITEVKHEEVKPDEVKNDAKDLKSDEVKSDDKEAKCDEKVSVEAKDDKSETGKQSDVLVVRAHRPVVEEEDLGWDEIEDIGSDDEKKVTIAREGSTNIADVRKRLSAADEDEDLSWDIEDDDEPVKA